MMRKGFHMVILLLAFLVWGCTAELVPADDEPTIRLKVRCDNPALATKADPEDDTFNENLIESVDFFFYPGATPDPETDAVHHVRKELATDQMVIGTSGNWEADFNLVIKKEITQRIFDDDDKATVYVLVNFSRQFINDLTHTSLNALAATTTVTDFPNTEIDHVQPNFLMDGKKVITFDEDGIPHVEDEIEVKRFAAKLTVAIHVQDQVILKHENPELNPDEIWTPVKHTMRIYLVDGAKTVLLSQDGMAPNPEYFSYPKTSRSYLNDENELSLNTVSFDNGSGVKEYYNTWPMYSYPRQWENTQWPDHSSIDYTNGLPPEPPYFKLEMDWRRESGANGNGYSYDRRKYYYKIYMPLDRLNRNNWYNFFVDVAILGSETDEARATLEPTCYLLDWQNKSFDINKYAVISKARYLSVDKTHWDIDNMEELSIPFLSSHNVKIVESSVTATRPYYGAINSSLKVGTYHTKLHAWIRKVNGKDSYYLDYTNQKGSPNGDEDYEPFGWLTSTSTTIKFQHPLENTYTKADFDYSPYTIEFDIIHTDLQEDSPTYNQYLQHITIVQYPGIYIECLRNSDTDIVKRNDSYNPYGYNTGSLPWNDKPWGYVFINGGRFIRYDKKPAASSDDSFYDLDTDNNKREYQWQTVWYTGGSKDMFDIHVTVLPKISSFVIGDPRENEVNNLDNEEQYPGLYKFEIDGDANKQLSYWNILENIRDGSVEYPEGKRTGFNKAPALYGDENGEGRTLRWYYPTDTNVVRTANMLAPSYRIASKFGGTEYGSGFFGDITKAYAEYRCAAYQEDGFPAGRWRLPTKAEIHFIAQLSSNDTFSERLFSNATYWSANGAVDVSNATVTDNDGATAALLRCVYDSWYWDNVDGLEGDPRHNPRDRFIWGDKPR